MAAIASAVGSMSMGVLAHIIGGMLLALLMVIGAALWRGRRKITLKAWLLFVLMLMLAFALPGYSRGLIPSWSLLAVSVLLLAVAVPVVRGFRIDIPELIRKARRQLFLRWLTKLQGRLSHYAERPADTDTCLALCDTALAMCEVVTTSSPRPEVQEKLFNMVYGIHRCTDMDGISPTVRQKLCMHLLDLYKDVTGLKPFVTEFSEYCDTCGYMLHRALNGRNKTGAQLPIVYTVQTTRGDPGDPKGRLREYLDTTVKLLIKYGPEYRRLIALPNNEVITKKRIRGAVVFSYLLISHACRAVIEGRRVDISRVSVGFADGEHVSGPVYGDMDIHCPAEDQFSLAWVPTPAGSFIGIHLHDTSRQIVASLRQQLSVEWQTLKDRRTLAMIGEAFDSDDVFDGMDISAYCQGAVLKTIKPAVESFGAQWDADALPHA